MRRACDAILQGDVYTAMADLTPEAVAEAMALAAGLVAVPTPLSYEIESHESAGGEHRFGVVFRTSAQDFRATATWREVDGAWKITSIRILEGLDAT
jgi:hypothetical protein